MIPERIERYAIERGDHGIVLRMRQGWRALGVAFISLAVLHVSWWFGPYGPGAASNWSEAGWFYWVWSAFFALAFMVALVGACYREDWTIGDQEIVCTSTLGPWRRVHRARTGRVLGIRVETTTGGNDTPIYSYRLHVLDAERKDSKLLIDLQQARSVDRILVALRSVLTVEVDDLRGRRSSKIGSS